MTDETQGAPAPEAGVVNHAEVTLAGIDAWAARKPDDSLDAWRQRTGGLWRHHHAA